MKKSFLWLLVFLSMYHVAKAHRLNEYLHATTISINKDSVQLHLHLVAGSDIASKLLSEIDRNNDGFISDTEQQAYTHLIVQNLFLYIDGTPATLRLINYSFPQEDDIKKGVGDIQVYLSAALSSTSVTHQIVFENHQQPSFSVYIVNCLLPADTSIHIISQSRNFDQSIYTVDFTTSNAFHALNTNQSLINETDNLAIIKTYFFHGVHHILTGYDHLLFLFALVLGAAGLWDLIKIVTAFTIAHSITLTLATFGLAHLPEFIVEPLISASIVFVAIQNIFWSKYAGGNGRLAIAFFFGLFHGLGFAGGLLELMHAMPPQMIVYAILGFSFGVEAGNQLVLLPLFDCLQLFKRIKREPLKLARQLTLQQFASGAVALAGAYYLFKAITINT